jgi:ER membrane protein complex subunit 3
MAAQMAQMNPGAGANMFQPGQDPDKMFQGEAENLEVLEHWSVLEGVEDRLVASI